MTKNEVFQLNSRIVMLLTTLFMVSGIGSVVIAQTRETLEVVKETSHTMSGMPAEELLAFIAVISMVLTGWTQWVLLRMSNELHERPCYYKKSQKEQKEFDR